MSGAIKCEGCGRNWSGPPYPNDCPECGYEMVSLPFVADETDDTCTAPVTGIAPPARPHEHYYRKDGNCACGAVKPKK